MKKNTTRFFSALAIAATVFSATAGPQVAKKLGGSTAKITVTQKVEVRPAATFKGAKLATSRPITNQATSQLLRSASKNALSLKKKVNVPTKEAGNLPDMYAMITFADGMTQDNNTRGIYKLPKAAGQDFSLVALHEDGCNTGFASDGVYYVTNYIDYGFLAFITLSAYDLTTGELLGEGSGQIDQVLVDCAVDPTTGTVYSIGYNSEGSGLQLAKVTPSITDGAVQFAVEPIAALDGFGWNSIACDPTGQLYAITYTSEGEGDNFTVTSSSLCKLDKTTGAITTVGLTGLTPTYLSSSEIDPKSGRMFWTLSTDAEGFLAEVNLQTGAATKLFDFALNEEVQGLTIPAPAAEEKAPAAVTDLAASFPEGALTGTVSFTAPTTLFDGTAASGALTYEVLANGTSVATGSTSFGATVSAPVTVESAGNYTFTVTVRNEVGKSPIQKVKTFVGNGIPEAPAATLEYTGGKMNLTWTAVTTSADGGYINPAEVTYTVTRFPGETAVATDTKSTSFSEPIAEPENITSYYYTVVAKYADAVSEAGKSNAVVLGSIVPPYEQAFDTEDGLDGFTVIDANDDGRQWSLYLSEDGGAARMTYNSSMAMDDWLMTPPLQLEAGKVYQLSFESYAYGTSFPERLEVKMGTSNTVDAMTTTLVEPLDITSSVPQQVVVYLAPKTSGKHFVGFHGISDADQFYLYLDNIKVGAATSADAPGEATNLKVVSDPNGDLKATVSFNAPSTTIGGGTLSSLTKVELSRDGELINTFNSPAVGAALSFVDTPAEGGNHTYTIVGYNNEGQGKPANITAFVGVDAPAAPESATIVETANEGEVTVSWSPVTTDRNGNVINPALITYIIAERGSSSWEPLIEGLTGTSHTFRAVEEGAEQIFAQYAVFASTSGGVGSGAITDMIPVGSAYEGMAESLPDGEPTHILGITTPAESSADWGIFDDSYFDGEPTSQDGDNGFIGMRGQYLDDAGSLFTGKVSLAGLVEPSFSFYTYNIVGENGESDTNIIEVEVKELGGEYTSVFNKTVVEICGPEEGWGKATVNLSAYAGKTIQVQITATITSFAYVFFDNLKIGSTVDNDLMAGTITAPANVQTGETYPVDVTVSNEGSKDAAPFTVDLFADGEKVDTKSCEALASGSSTHVVFERTMHALATEPVELYAVVNAAADDIADNNTTKTISVAPKVSTLPAPTELKAEAANSGVQLTWSEPNLEGGIGTVVTESFEDGESFAQEFEDWTFVDVDNSPVGGFQGLEIPGISTGTDLVSFFVFDSTPEQFNETFAAHSGSKYLAAMFRYDDGTTDDWAISPVLDGSAQTVSFYARSYSGSYPEKIEILYSTGSINPEDFVAVKTVATVPADWTLYEAELPAGAMHFAIRSCATGSFMLMIDDVTFTSGSQTADLSLLGYNVYRNGVKLNAEPVEESSLLDLEGLADHKYQVTALYEGRGESAGSNEASVNQGIADITDGLSIATDKGLILVNGADDKLVTVTAVDGRVIYSAKGNASVSVATGIYVVKAGKTVAKVLVK